MVKGIQVCSNEINVLFFRGDDNEMFVCFAYLDFDVPLELMYLRSLLLRSLTKKSKLL